MSDICCSIHSSVLRYLKMWRVFVLDVIDQITGRLRRNCDLKEKKKVLRAACIGRPHQRFVLNKGGIRWSQSHRKPQVLCMFVFMAVASEKLTASH